MKTLKVLTTAFLVTGTLSGFATGYSAMKPSGVFINSPATVWGDPSDVNAESVEALKKPAVEFPAITWGNSDDVFSKSVESLKTVIANPEPNWGIPDDVNSPSVQALKKITFFEGPQVVWGDVNDINLSSVKSLKTLQK